LVAAAGPALRLLDQRKTELEELELHLAHLAAEQVRALGEVLDPLGAREDARLGAQDHAQAEAQDAHRHEHLEEGEALTSTPKRASCHHQSSRSEYSPSMRGSGRLPRPFSTLARPVRAL